jgi:hypothetical protein
MPDFTIKAHDTYPSIEATLFRGSTPVDLTNASGVKFIMATAPGGTVKIQAAGVIVDAAIGTVRYDWLAADTATPGTYEAEWEVTWPTGKQTFPTASYHEIAILADLDNA